jgi:hypothetical protein
MDRFRGVDIPSLEQTVFAGIGLDLSSSALQDLQRTLHVSGLQFTSPLTQRMDPPLSPDPIFFQHG